MEAYRKKVKGRAIGGCVLIIGLALFFILAKALGFLPPPSGEKADYLLGNQFGALCGVEAVAIIRTIRNFLLLRNGAKLEKARIYEQDERICEIARRSCQTTVMLTMVALLIALLVSASYSYVVTMKLTAATFVFLIIYLGTILFYNKKL